MKPIMIYVTAPSQAEALAIGRTLVEENLIACANVLPNMTSVYRWEGKIEQAEEAVLILKTGGDMFARVQDRIKALHPYSCPCIISWQMEDGNPEYLKWITNNVP